MSLVEALNGISGRGPPPEKTTGVMQPEEISYTQIDPGILSPTYGLSSGLVGLTLTGGSPASSPETSPRKHTDSTNRQNEVSNFQLRNGPDSAKPVLMEEGRQGLFEGLQYTNLTDTQGFSAYQLLYQEAEATSQAAELSAILTEEPSEESTSGNPRRRRSEAEDLIATSGLSNKSSGRSTPNSESSSDGSRRTRASESRPRAVSAQSLHQEQKEAVIEFASRIRALERSSSKPGPRESPDSAASEASESQGRSPVLDLACSVTRIPSDEADWPDSPRSTGSSESLNTASPTNSPRGLEGPSTTAMAPEPESETSHEDRDPVSRPDDLPPFGSFEGLESTPSWESSATSHVDLDLDPGLPVESNLEGKSDWKSLMEDRSGQRRLGGGPPDVPRPLDLLQLIDSDSRLAAAEAMGFNVDRLVSETAAFAAHQATVAAQALSGFESGNTLGLSSNDFAALNGMNGSATPGSLSPALGALDSLNPGLGGGLNGLSTNAGPANANSSGPNGLSPLMGPAGLNGATASGTPPTTTAKRGRGGGIGSRGGKRGRGRGRATERREVEYRPTFPVDYTATALNPPPILPTTGDGGVPMTAKGHGKKDRIVPIAPWTIPRSMIPRPAPVPGTTPVGSATPTLGSSTDESLGKRSRQQMVGESRSAPSSPRASSGPSATSWSTPSSPVRDVVTAADGTSPPPPSVIIGGRRVIERGQGRARGGGKNKGRPTPPVAPFGPNGVRPMGIPPLSAILGLENLEGGGTPRSPIPKRRKTGGPGKSGLGKEGEEYDEEVTYTE